MFLNEELNNEEVVVEETTTEEAPAVEEAAAPAEAEEAPATEEASEEASSEESTEEAAPAAPKKAPHVPTVWAKHPSPFTAQERRFSRDNFEEKVVQIRRVVKTVKGGRNFKFSALIVAGDKQGQVGYGAGKSREVPVAIKKGIKNAKKDIAKVTIAGAQDTVAHEVIGKHGSARVMIKPAKEGTGLIASDVVRSVLELAGYRNAYTKILSKTNNPQNIVKAVVNGLKNINPSTTYGKRRGKEVSGLEAKVFKKKAPQRRDDRPTGGKK